MKLFDMKFIVLFSFILLFSFLGNSQKQRLKKAKELYLIESYYEAAETFEDVVERGIDSSEVAPEIAHAYFVLRNNQKALVWHQYMYKNKMLDTTAYARYLNLNMEKKSSEKIEQLINEAIKLFPDSDYFTLLHEKYFNHEIEVLDSDFFTLKPMQNVNTEASEFGVSYYKDNKVLLTSSTRVKKVYNRKDERSNQFFYNLFKAELIEDGLGSLEFDKTALQSKYHDGPACYDPTNEFIYFTRNNLDGKKAVDENKKVTHLKIFRGRIVNNEIVNVESLPFNSDLYSTMHPSISADGTKLFFSSNMPGGYGGFDLYVVEINKQGMYSAPKNLGPKVNSILDDVFPFYQQNGSILFFSSNGHIGSGGLDIFFSEIADDLTTIKTLNAGTSINSEYDDFSFVNDSEQKSGFMASNRNGENQNDDIFAFSQKEPLTTTFYWLAGLIRDKDTDELLKDVAVTIEDEDNNRVFQDFTDENGSFKTEKLDDIMKGDSINYTINLAKDEYITQTFPLNVLADKEQEIDVNKYLELRLKKVEIGETDLAEVANINPIYFDYDKANIREDAAKELDKIIDLLRDNPGMIIELGSHTDSRGNANYNLELSNRRAKSSVEYIVSQGIEKYRVFGTGYGELVPRVSDQEIQNIDDEEEQERLHQMNRRTEFIILEMGEKKYVSSNEPPSYTDLSRIDETEKDSTNKKDVVKRNATFKDRSGKEISGKEFNKENIEKGFYIVLPHETLYRIYVNTGVEIEKLKELNNLKNNHIEPGQKILIR